MEQGQTTRNGGNAVFRSGDKTFTVRDLIDASAFWGELEQVWNELLRLVAAEEQANEKEMELDDSAIDQAAEAFRYEHDLITAEETERWLQARGLTLNDFSEYFVRHYWGDALEGVEPEAVEYASAPNELRELLVVELILSGELGRMAKRMSWRVAGSQEAGHNGFDPEASDVSSGDLTASTQAGFTYPQLKSYLFTLNVNF